eukprot:Em0461g1a
MPGRTKVTKMIDELHEDMMLKLKDMLKQSSSVSLTTDAAKMPTGLSYSAITGHWISSGWELLSAVLAVSISNISHTAQEIGSLIMELGIKYTLDDRLDAIATDNGANLWPPWKTCWRMGYVKNIELRSAQSGGPIINLLVEDEQDDGEHQVNEGASDAAPKDASFHSSPRGHTLKLIKADPEKKKASVRDSYKTDPEKKKASVRDSYKADPEKKKASVRDSYKADPEKKKASVRDSYKADPEKKAPVRDSYKADPN